MSAETEEEEEKEVELLAMQCSVNHVMHRSPEESGGQKQRRRRRRIACKAKQREACDAK